MKVLFLISSGRMGGLERHVQCLAQSLPKEVESLICATGQDGAATEAMRAVGLNVVALGCSSGHDVRLLPRFHKVMRDFKPDVVHGHSTALLASFYLKWFSRVPLIQSLHMPAGNRTLKNRIFDKIAKRTDYYLPVSAETWKGYQRIYPTAKGEVMFNPLLLDSIPKKDRHYIRRELGLADDVRIVGAVGRLSYQKNWPAFLEVGIRLLKQSDRIHLVAVGEGPDAQDLRMKWDELTRDCPMNRERLHWLGNRQDAKQLFGGMDIFLFMSHHEELPTVLLEAFGMQTPVVGRLPVGGAKEVLALSNQQSAWLIEEPNVEVIAENVQTVLADPTRAKSMTETGREILEKYFDAKKICEEQLMTVYRNILV